MRIPRRPDVCIDHRLEIAILEVATFLIDEANDRKASSVHGTKGPVSEGMSFDEWEQGEPCERDGIPYCADCKPSSPDDDEPRFVYITEGWGAAYHKIRDCPALIEGQKFVERKGGTPAPVKRVALSTAKATLHSPCQVCFR